MDIELIKKKASEGFEWAKRLLDRLQEPNNSDNSVKISNSNSKNSIYYFQKQTNARGGD